MSAQRPDTLGSGGSNSSGCDSNSAYAEDKKCRICSFADTKNVNIFNPNNKTLLNKILAVYPIVLYENDPLPKNICKKCIYNVGLMYNDIQRVLRTQSKWIGNVRSVQPNHSYLRVLDLLEHTKSVTQVSIKATLGEGIGETSIHRHLFHQKGETAPSDNSTYSQSVEKQTDSPTTKIKDIKSLLELNGCSLLTVDGKAAAAAAKDDINGCSVADLAQVQIKAEIDEDDMKLSEVAHYMTVPPPLTVKCRYCPLQFKSLATLASHQLLHLRICIPRVWERKILAMQKRRGRLITVNERKCIRCLNCWRVFGDNKSILQHWSIGECEFYCHICGEDFAQAPALLREHVPTVHGISYRSSRMQRIFLPTPAKSQPIPSHKSFTESPDYRAYQAITEQEPLPGEEDNSSVVKTTPKTPSKAKKVHSTLKPSTHPYTKSTKKNTKSQFYSGGKPFCPICHKAFQNMHARNSHMRKHKPAFAYGGIVIEPDARKDSYTTPEHESRRAPSTNSNILPAAHAILPNQLCITSTPTSSLNEPPALAPVTVGTPNCEVKAPVTVIRGIRTKFVRRRSELANVTAKPVTDLQPSSAGNVCPLVNSVENPINEPNPNNATTVDNTMDHLLTVIKNEPIDVEEEYHIHT